METYFRWNAGGRKEWMAAERAPRAGHIEAFAFDPWNPGVIYAAGEGIFKSIDNGNLPATAIRFI